MSRITHRLPSVAAAVLCTLVILAGIDRIAVSSPSATLIANATATARA